MQLKNMRLEDFIETYMEAKDVRLGALIDRGWTSIRPGVDPEHGEWIAIMSPGDEVLIISKN